MPDAPQVPEIDRTGRTMVLTTLDKIVGALGLTEEHNADGDAVLPLFGAGGPLEGQRIGEFRVFSRADGTRVVYSALAVDAFGMDTHQVYAYTASDSAVPHLFLDSAISPNTDGTFHFGLDLIPRVDLGANLDYSEVVYGPVTEARAEALSQPGVMGVPSLGPLQWSIRSPWMAAAIVAPDDLRKLGSIVDVYVDHWLGLMNNGLPAGIVTAAETAILDARDRRNREAMFSPRTNPVWGLLDKLVGPDVAQAMKDVLIKG